MLFANQFRISATVACVLVALVTTTTADPAPMGQRARADSPSVDVDDTTGVQTVVYASRAELLQWLSTIDPSLVTYTGNPINPDPSEPAADTTVVYCANKSGSNCQPPCTVHNGGPGCIYAPGTNCLSATSDVSFCSTSDCTKFCNTYDDCGDRLDDGYCYTPGTNSIFVIPH